MSDREIALSERARVFREELDGSFGRPRAIERPALVGLLAIRVGDAPYALPIAEIEALIADRPVTRMPSPVRELLGLCAVRGAIIPVYDLAPLLGHDSSREHIPRWLVLGRRREPIAIAFDALEAQVQVPVGEIAGSAGESSEAVSVLGALRPLIRIASVLDAIEQRVTTVTGASRT